MSVCSGHISYSVFSYQIHVFGYAGLSLVSMKCLEPLYIRNFGYLVYAIISKALYLCMNLGLGDSNILNIYMVSDVALVLNHSDIPSTDYKVHQFIKNSAIFQG